jgi:radical SAM superfamily enzyme YgiQ (UPF0313 family)|tara:strand:+ start:446 stop:1921 length:1476 start_codon:yes stop_codon:yes gene_type:complete
MSYVEQFDIASKFDIKVKEFSIFRDSIESIIRRIKEEIPDVVGFSTYIWNINEILSIIQQIDAITILGGPQVSGIERELLQKNAAIDFIVTGEGEISFKGFLEYLDGDRRLENLKGISTKEIHCKPSKVVDLNSIPSFYDRIFENYPDLSWISIETSRGCVFGCKYCTWGYTNQIRYYPVKRIKKDLDIIMSQDSIKNLYFCDSSILLNKKRTKNILKHIISKSPNMSIRFEFAAEQLDDEVIDLLVQINSGEINFGFQSISNNALKDMGRKFNKIKFEENFYKIVDKFKGSVTIDVIYGLPGDNIEGYKESLNYLISLENVSRILTNPLIILPGSQFYKDMRRYGIRLKDKKSYIIRSNYTFSMRDMELAKKYSFYVTLVYLNYRLRDAIKSYAEFQEKRYIDTIIEFMESLPFKLVEKDYPDMIPSIKEGFNKRKNAFKTVFNKYSDMIEYLKIFTNHKYDTRFDDYEEHFSNHFYKMQNYATADQELF